MTIGQMVVTIKTRLHHGHSPHIIPAPVRPSIHPNAPPSSLADHLPFRSICSIYFSVPPISRICHSLLSLSKNFALLTRNTLAIKSNALFFSDLLEELIYAAIGDEVV